MRGGGYSVKNIAGTAPKKSPLEACPSNPTVIYAAVIFGRERAGYRFHEGSKVLEPPQPQVPHPPSQGHVGRPGLPRSPRRCPELLCLKVVIFTSDPEGWAPYGPVSCQPLFSSPPPLSSPRKPPSCSCCSQWLPVTKALTGDPFTRKCEWGSGFPAPHKSPVWGIAPSRRWHKGMDHSGQGATLAQSPCGWTVWCADPTQTCAHIPTAATEWGAEILCFLALGAEGASPQPRGSSSLFSPLTLQPSPTCQQPPHWPG